MSALLPDRAWNTWHGGFPACMMHVPSRFAVRVTMFSTTENRYEEFCAVPQESFTLGEHATDGKYVELQLHSAGTTLALEFGKPSWANVVGRVRIIKPGEMLFRLNILVEVGFLAPATPDARGEAQHFNDGRTRTLALGGSQAGTNRMPQSAVGTWRSQHFYAAVDQVPALAGQYEHVAALKESLERRGWLYHPPAIPRGDWVAFRFYGNPRQALHFAVAQHGDGEAAQQAAEQQLARATETIDRLAVETAGQFAVVDVATADLAGPRSSAAVVQGASDGKAAKAVRDVLAWNTIWDEENHRPYTCPSRAWLEGFGGWGVWMSDAHYAVMMSALIGDTEGVRANLRSVLSAQQAAGNVPALTAADEEWVDRTQLPVAAFTTWQAYLLTGDVILLKEVYPALQRQIAWTTISRDGNGNGLYEYGTSPMGNAQGAQTKQGALNESGMDNLAIFDDAEYRLDVNTIDLEEPGHNSLIALELEALGAIARILGRDGEADAYGEQSRGLSQRIAERLWDPERKIFAARRWDGSFAQHLSPTSFFPLLTGAVASDRVNAMLYDHLFNEEEFWGPLPLPTAPFNDPVNAEASYWRGRIWAPMSYWVWEGLRRSGYQAEARKLARASWDMFEQEWSQRRRCRENYSSLEPDAHAAHDSDPFYTWGALFAFMWTVEQSNLNLSADPRPSSVLTTYPWRDGND